MNAAGDASATFRRLLGLRIGELVCILDKPTASTATASQCSVARETRLDGGMALHRFREAEGCRIDGNGTAAEFWGDKLYVEMVCSIDVA